MQRRINKISVSIDTNKLHQYWYWHQFDPQGTHNYSSNVNRAEIGEKISYHGSLWCEECSDAPCVSGSSAPSSKRSSYEQSKHTHITYQQWVHLKLAKLRVVLILCNIPWTDCWVTDVNALNYSLPHLGKYWLLLWAHVWWNKILNLTYLN